MTSAANNVSTITPPIDNNICQNEIKRAAKISKNIKVYAYVHDGMLKFRFNLPQIMKLFSEGEYTDIREERASSNRCGFTVAFKFAGDSEACHIRGWYDRSTNLLDLTDMFMCDTLSI